MLLGPTPAALAEVPVSWLPPAGFIEQPPQGPTSASPPAFAFERAWTRQAEGWTEHIVQVTVRKPLSLRRYLTLWRANHGCTLSPLRASQTLSWAGRHQSTWSGSCEGGDVFLMHIARIGNTFFEFHVGRRLGLRRAPGTTSSSEALRRLLDAMPEPRRSALGMPGRPKQVRRLGPQPHSRHGKRSGHSTGASSPD